VQGTTHWTAQSLRSDVRGLWRRRIERAKFWLAIVLGIVLFPATLVISPFLPEDDEEDELEELL
jgi:hypothetical protein